MIKYLLNELGDVLFLSGILFYVAAKTSFVGPSGYLVSFEARW